MAEQQHQLEEALMRGWHDHYTNTPSNPRLIRALSAAVINAGFVAPHTHRLGYHHANNPADCYESCLETNCNYTTERVMKGVS